MLSPHHATHVLRARAIRSSSRRKYTSRERRGVLCKLNTVLVTLNLLVSYVAYDISEDSPSRSPKGQHWFPSRDKYLPSSEESRRRHVGMSACQHVQSAKCSRHHAGSRQANKRCTLLSPEASYRTHAPTGHMTRSKGQHEVLQTSFAPHHSSAWRRVSNGGWGVHFQHGCSLRGLTRASETDAASAQPAPASRQTHSC